nr:amino acid permease [Limosilactobacillus mucosae]
MADSNKIGKYELTALIVGATIGSGIFGVNSDLANVAAPGPVILGWLIVGLGVWCLIAALNHLLLRYPKQDAGIFAYAGLSLGPLGEFISGWLHGWATSPLPRLR